MSMQAEKVLWAPNPGPQTAFIACPVREILFGGAKGGGKTDAIGPKALKHIEAYGQWAYVLILRETLPQLREIRDRMRPLCLILGGTYNKTEKTWSFPSGARIQFGHTQDGCDPYWGQEYSLIIIDEVTRTIKTEHDYHMLLGSLRNSHGVPCSIILTSNPGGVGHVWVKERFMGVPPLTVHTDPKTGLERVYIPAKLTDNPKLPQDYRLQLEQMGEAEQRAYIEGDWDAFEGTVFKLERNVHIWTWAQFKSLIGDDAIPHNWTVFRAMDWGYAKPYSIAWYAVDFDGTLYRFCEMYGVAKDSQGRIKANEGVRQTPEDVAKKIARIDKQLGCDHGIADPAIWAKGQGDHGGGPSIAEVMLEHGVSWSPAKNDRIQGKMQVHQRLAHGKYMPPKLILIAEECTHLIRTLPTLEYDEHVVEDVDTDGEDHAYDELRYACMSRPLTPTKLSPEDKYALIVEENGADAWVG